jgi:hypothetical protein
METIILKVDNKSNAKKLCETLPLLKGVKHVSMTNDNKKDEDIMAEIELSLNQVKMIRDGKLPGRSLKQIISGK